MAVDIEKLKKDILAENLKNASGKSYTTSSPTKPIDLNDFEKVVGSGLSNIPDAKPIKQEPYVSPEVKGVTSTYSLIDRLTSIDPLVFTSAETNLIYKGIKSIGARLFGEVNDENKKDAETLFNSQVDVVNNNLTLEQKKAQFDINEQLNKVFPMAGKNIDPATLYSEKIYDLVKTYKKKQGTPDNILDQEVSKELTDVLGFKYNTELGAWEKNSEFKPNNELLASKRKEIATLNAQDNEYIDKLKNPYSDPDFTNEDEIVNEGTHGLLEKVIPVLGSLEATLTGKGKEYRNRQQEGKALEEKNNDLIGLYSADLITGNLAAKNLKAIANINPEDPETFKAITEESNTVTNLIPKTPEQLDGFKKSLLKKGILLNTYNNPVNTDVTIDKFINQKFKDTPDSQRFYNDALVLEEKSMKENINSYQANLDQVNKNIDLYRKAIEQKGYQKDWDDQLKKQLALKGVLQENINKKQDYVSFIETQRNGLTIYKDQLAQQARLNKLAEIDPLSQTFSEFVRSVAEIPSGISASTQNIYFRAAQPLGLETEKSTNIFAANKFTTEEGSLGSYLSGKGLAFGGKYTGMSPKFPYETISGEQKMGALKDAPVIDILDDEGNFKVTFNPYPFLLTSGNVALQSFLLGSTMTGASKLFAGLNAGLDASLEAGFLAGEEAGSLAPTMGALGEDISLSLGEGLTAVGKQGLAYGGKLGLSIAETTVGSIAPSILMYGDEMLKQEMEKGLTFNQANTISNIRAGIEGLTERIFPNEMSWYKSIIGKGAIKNYAELAEKEGYKELIEQSIEKLTGKKVKRILIDSILNPSKESLKVLGEESSEEVLGLLFGEYPNKLAKEYNPEYTPNEEFNPQTILSTIVQTSATMLPMGGQVFLNKIREHSGAQIAAQLQVGESPDLYIPTIQNLLENKAITKEEADRRYAYVQLLKEKAAEVNSKISMKERNTLTDEQISARKNALMKNLMAQEELKKALNENPTEETRLKIAALFDEKTKELSTLIEQGAFKTDEERIANASTNLEFYLPDSAIEKSTNTEDLNKIANNLAKYANKETDENLRNAYLNKINLINNRVSSITKVEEQEERKTLRDIANNNNANQSIIVNTIVGEAELEYNKPYYGNIEIELFKEGKKIEKPVETIIKKDNGDGTLTITENNVEKIVPIDYFKDKRVTSKETVENWREQKDPKAFLFDHLNTIFSYDFKSKNKNRDQVVFGRLRFNSNKNAIVFKYKDKNGKIQDQLLDVTDLELFMNNSPKSNLKLIRELETEEEYNKRIEKAQKQLKEQTDLKKLQDQLTRRYEFIQNYINSKIEYLKNIKDSIKSTEDELLDVEIELEQFQKSFEEKEKIYTKKGALRVDAKKLINKLKSLEERKEKLVEALKDLEDEKQNIEQELEYVKNYKESKTFEQDKSIVDQMLDDWVDLNDFKSKVEESISDIEKLIKGIDDIINGFIDGIKKVLTNARLIYPDVKIDLNKVNALRNIGSFSRRNPDAYLMLDAFNQVINSKRKEIEDEKAKIGNLNKTLKANLELADKVQKNIKYQENLIKAAQKAQSKFLSDIEAKALSNIASQIFNDQNKNETNNLVNDNEEDAKLIKPEGDKVSLEELFSTTTSGSTENSLNLSVPEVNRLQTFLNNITDLVNYKLLVITKNNAKKYGLEDILYTDKEIGITNDNDNEENNDIKLVVVKIDSITNAVSFVDEKGNLLETDTQNKNNIVYTSLRRAVTEYQSGPRKGEKNYYYKGDEKSEKELEEKLKENHKKFRQTIIDASSNPDNILSLGIDFLSRGREAQEGQPTPVLKAVNLSEVDINSVPVIQIPKSSSPTSSTGEVIFNSKKSISMPIGRPTLSWKQHFGFLLAKKFNKADSEKFLKIFVYIYNIYKDNKQIDKDVLNYLNKTLYFRNPENISKITNQKQDPDKIGRSQIWFSKEGSNVYLNLGKNYKIFFNLDESNTKAYIDIKAYFLGSKEGVYHNVDDKDLVGKPFVEILDIKNGLPVKKVWNSYQEYLISDEGRKTEDIPLTIKRNASTEVSPNIGGRYIIFNNPDNADIVGSVSNTPITEVNPSNNNNVTSVNTEKILGEKVRIINAKGSSIKNNSIYKMLIKPVSGGESSSYTFKYSDGNVTVLATENSQAEKEVIEKAILKRIKENTAFNANEMLFEIKSKPTSSVTPTVTPIEQTKSSTWAAISSEIKSEEKYEDISNIPATSDWASVTKPIVNNQRDNSNTASVTDPTTETIGNDVFLENLKKAKELAASRKNLPEEEDPYRIAKPGEYKLENLQEAKNWLKERFPQFQFKVIQGLVDNKAWGQLRGNLIILSNVAEIGTIYHEAFEGVYKYILSKSQQNRLKRDFKNRIGSFVDRETGKLIKYSEATDHQIKEQIAEECRDYQLSNGTIKWQGETVKNSLFRQIYDLIHDFVFNTKNQEEIFKRMSEAKYKDKIIDFKTNDIIRGDRVSELQKRNPILFNDIMQSITAIIFAQMQKQNRNISEVLLSENFNLETEQEVAKIILDNFYGGEATTVLINGISKESFVDKFKSDSEYQQEIRNSLETNSKILFKNIEEIEKNKNLLKDKVAEKIYDIIDTYTYINNNWEDIKKDHNKYLVKYNLEVKEEDEETSDVEENSKSRESDIRDSLKISRKLNANTEVKLLFATLVEQEYLPKAGNKTLNVENANEPRETRKKINSIMLYSLVDYNVTITKLLYKFSKATTFEDMANILKEEAKINASLLPIITKLKIGNENNLTKYDIDLRSKFFVSFNNMLINFNKNLINEDLTGSLVNINELNNINSLKNKWFNQFQANNKVFKVVGGKVVIDQNALGVPNVKNFNDALKLFKNLGIDDPININRLNDTEKEQLFKLGLELYKIIKTHSADNLRTNSIIVSKTMTAIATIYNNHIENQADSQHINIDGELVQNILLQNFVGYVSKVINKTKSLEGLVKEIPQLNPFSKNNVWLKNSLVLDPNSKILKRGVNIEIVEGSQQRDSSEGNSTQSLNIVDRFLQELALNISGVYYVLTPADTKTEWGIRWGEFVNKITAKNNVEVLRIFKDYLKAEIELARLGNPTNSKQIQEYLDAAKKSGNSNNKLRFFKDIITVPLDIDSEKSIDDVIAENEAKIDQDILTYIEDRTKDTLDKLTLFKAILPYEEKNEQEKATFISLGLSDLKSIPYVSKEIIGEGLTEEEIKDLIRQSEINYTINIIEQYKLFLGDPAQWKDPSKRVKSYVSGRTSLVHSDKYFNQFYNQANNNLEFTDENGNLQKVTLVPGDFGYSFYDDTLKIQVFNEPVVASTSYEKILKSLRDSTSQDIFGVNYDELSSDREKKEVDDLVEADSYTDVKEADAQAFAFPNGYKEIRLRSNTWADADEEQKEWDDALCRMEKLTGKDYYTGKDIPNITKENLYPKGDAGELLKQRDIQLLDKGNPFLNRYKDGKKLPILNVYKPIYSGFKEGDVADQELDKMSIAPLTWRIVRGTPAEAFYVNHYKENTTYIIMDSGNKVGQTTDQVSLYNEDGKPNLTIRHKVLNFKYFGLQVETITQKFKTTFGTQMSALATLNLLDGGVPIDFKRKNSKLSEKDLLNTWESLSEEQKRNTETGSKLYRLATRNYEVLSNLKLQAKNKLFKEFGISETKNEEGKDVYTFTNLEKFEKLIQRELSSRQATENLKNALVIDPFTGQFLVKFDAVIGSDRLESLLTSIINKNILRPKMFGGQMPQIASSLFERSKRIYTTKYRGKKLLVSNDLKFYENEDGKRYCEIYLPFFMKEFLKQGKELSINDIPDDLKYGIGFRIPTQETNSIEHFKIKGFLPAEYGNSIVVPSEITTKAGSDFDIDKLNIYLYNYAVKKGQPYKIEYMGDNFTTEERYRRTIEEDIFDYEDIVEDNEEFNKILQNKFEPIFDKVNEAINKKIKSSEIGKEFDKSYQDFKEEVLKIGNKNIRDSIFDIQKKQDIGLIDRQTNLELYIKTLVNSKTIPQKEAKQLNKVLLAYDNYINLSNEEGKFRELLKNLIKQTNGYQQVKEQLTEIKKKELVDFIINNNLYETSFEEFSKLSIDLQNSKKALENSYLDNLREILQLPEMFPELMRPNSAEVLKSLAKDINRLYKVSPEKKSYYYLSRVSNLQDRHNFLVGKEGVGIAASQQKQHAFFQNIGLFYELPLEKAFLFKTNGVEEETKVKYNLAKRTDALGRKISNTISSFVDAFVDIAKDPYISTINGNLKTAGLYLAAVKLGIPIKTVVLWFNQPIIRDYVFALLENESLLTQVQGKVLMKDLIRAEVRNKYTEKITLGEYENQESDRTELFTDSELKRYIKDYVEANEVENKADVKYTQKFVDNQLLLLDNFIELEALQTELFNPINSTNIDTSAESGFESMRIKMGKINKALNSVFRDDIKKLYENTFLGTIYRAKRDLLKAIAPLYITEREDVRSVLDPILNHLYTKIAKSDVVEKQARDLKKHFISYLLHTVPFTLEEGKKPLLLSAYVKDLMLNPDNNIAKRLRNLQEKEKDNFFVNNLFGFILDPVDKLTRKTNNVKLLRRLSDKIDNDLMTADFWNLDQSGKTTFIMKDLIKTVLLQNGINADPYTFSQLIPNDTFKKIMDQIEIYLSDTTNVEKTIPNFLNSYYENLWWNPNVVPKASKFSKTSMKKERSKWKSRLQTDWLNKELSDDDKKILKNVGGFLTYWVSADENPIISYGNLKEASNPYLLWTDIDPRYTKREKEEMAKKGDYSFIVNRLYKRLEVPYKDGTDIPLLQKEYDSRSSYHIIYYPVDRKGERFNILEHSSEPKNSQIYHNYNTTITAPERILEIFEKQGRFDKKVYLYENVIPKSMPEKGSITDIIDRKLYGTTEEAPSVIVEKPEVTKKVKFEKQNIFSITPQQVTTSEKLKAVANIPQNKVSGIDSYGSTVIANNAVIKALGSNPHSIDMVEAGFRTRTTRSADEMTKYNVKVGDIIKHFGESADGTIKNIYARVTAIHPKGSEGWKGTWYKEGWREEDVDVIDRFKKGAAAIEFELIKPTTPTAQPSTNLPGPETKSNLPGLDDIPTPQCGA